MDEQLFQIYNAPINKDCKSLKKDPGDRLFGLSLFVALASFELSINNQSKWSTPRQ